MLNIPEKDKWKEAVLDFCSINWTKFYPDDPHRTIKELLTSNANMALDPQISSEAKRLLDKYEGAAVKLLKEFHSAMLMKMHPARFRIWLADFITRVEFLLNEKAFPLNKEKE